MRVDSVRATDEKTETVIERQASGEKEEGKTSGAPSKYRTTDSRWRRDHTEHGVSTGGDRCGGVRARPKAAAAITGGRGGKDRGDSAGTVRRNVALPDGDDPVDPRLSSSGVPRYFRDQPAHDHRRDSLLRVAVRCDSRLGACARPHR